jgi:hypothetical protein
MRSGNGPEVWILRAGGAGEAAANWHDKGIGTLGFTGDAPVSDYSRTALEQHLAARGLSPGGARQLAVFRSEVQIGDLLLSPVRHPPIFYVGWVTGDYQWSQQPVDGNHHHYRSVRWFGPFDKSELAESDRVFQPRSTLTRVADADRRGDLLRFAGAPPGPSYRTTAPGSASDFGRAYVPANESVQSAERDPFSVDPDAIDRGNRGHAATQNLLAAWVTEQGWTALSYRPGEPAYDIAWKTHTAVYVAEVKSLTSTNEETQLRLGLGQVLRYRHALAPRFDLPVMAVLAVERRPADLTWHQLCDSVGVRLVSPDSFGLLAARQG